MDVPISEDVVLQMLKLGHYDGFVDGPYQDERKYLIEHRIEHGIPRTYERAPIWALFHKQDGPISYGRERIAHEYLTDEEKLMFIGKEGFRIGELYAYYYSLQSPEKPFHLTEYEIRLLIALRITDEPVGKIFRNKQGSFIVYRIEEGIPTKWEGKPIKRKVDGRMKIVDYTAPTIVREYRTEKEKLHFLKQYGHYLSDEGLQKYSKQSGCMVFHKDYPPKPESLPVAAEKESIPRTDFESHLLTRLHAGELDGPVGTPYDNGYGSMIWYSIEDGTVKRFKRGPIKRVFDGYETEKIIPDWKLDSELKTEEEELNFMRRSGCHMKDPEVIAYSDEYWDNYRDRKNNHSNASRLTL